VEGATIAAIGSNLPALDHTLLENTHSPSPFDVPTPVIDAIRSPAVRSAIYGCVSFLLFLALLVADMEGDATPRRPRWLFFRASVHRWPIISRAYLWQRGRRCNLPSIVDTRRFQTHR